jgi:hypothetical protein
MAREWYRFFLNLFQLTGNGQSTTSLEDLQVSPPSQDVIGQLGIVYDQAQLAAMLAQYEDAARQALNRLDAQPALPQLGTLSAVNEDNVRLIGFSNNPSPAVPNPAPIGTLYWDGNSTLGLQMNQSVLVRIGQAQFVYVKASASITKGQLCKHTGSVGASGVITAAPTSTGMTDPVQIVGVAAQDIALNDFGFIQISGDIRGFDTTGTSVGEVWADGDSLYYNPSFVGGLTKTKPSAPNIKTYVGEVINAGSGGSGSINIRIVYGSVLGGTDANVQFGILADKDLIQYDSALQYWKNVSSSSIAIGTATNVAGGTAGSLLYQSASSTTTFLSIGTSNYVLTSNGTAPVWTANTGTDNVVRSTSPTIATPTITTSATVPLVIGGTGTTSTLTLRSTSGVGTTGADIIFQTGNNGATECMRIRNSGNVGIGTATPGYKLTLNAFTGVTGPVIALKQSAETSAFYGFGIQRSGDTSTLGIGFNSTADAWSFSASYASTGGYKPIAFSTSDLERFKIDTSGNVLVTGAGGLGYGTGSGGAVTQSTSRTTGVTLNKTNGAITLVSAAGSTAWQTFTVTNSTVAATDVIRICQKSGTDLYMIHVTNVSAGSFNITFATTGGTTTEQPVFNFAVTKAVTA